MLVDIFSGRDRNSAHCKGSFHFSTSPAPGEQLELGGERFTVTDAWHVPDIHFRRAKLAILVGEDIEPARLSDRTGLNGAIA